MAEIVNNKADGNGLHHTLNNPCCSQGKMANRIANFALPGNDLEMRSWCYAAYHSLYTSFLYRRLAVLMSIDSRFRYLVNNTESMRGRMQEADESTRHLLIRALMSRDTRVRLGAMALIPGHERWLFTPLLLQIAMYANDGSEIAALYQLAYGPPSPLLTAVRSGVNHLLSDLDSVYKGGSREPWSRILKLLDIIAQTSHVRRTDIKAPAVYAD